MKTSWGELKSKFKDAGIIICCGIGTGFYPNIMRKYFLLLLEYHQKNLQYIKARLPLLEPIKRYNTENPLWVFSLPRKPRIVLIGNFWSQIIDSFEPLSIKKQDFELIQLYHSLELFKKRLSLITIHFHLISTLGGMYYLQTFNSGQ